MDKKLIFYLLVLCGLVIAIFISAKSSKLAEAGGPLPHHQVELLLDTGHFDIDTSDGSLITLYEDGTTLTHKELGDGGAPSPEVLAAYDRFLDQSEESTPLAALGTFALFIGTGIFAGFLIISYLLPSLIQRASEEVYGSSEKVGPQSPLSQAQSHVAQGDWEQAIACYRQAANDEPDNRLPWVEIVALQKERLENAPLALQTLDDALARGGWRENDEAFFLFRKIEIYENDLKQPQQALSLLHEVIEKFPETRHSANARHKLAHLNES